MRLETYWHTFWKTIWKMSRIQRVSWVIAGFVIMTLLALIDERLIKIALAIYCIFFIVPINIVTFSSNPYEDDNKNDKNP